MSEQDNFSDNLFTNRLSWQTPEMLLHEHGESGLANIHSEKQVELKDAEAKLAETRRAFDDASEVVKDIRADIDAIQQAQQLGRDKGLE